MTIDVEEKKQILFSRDNVKIIDVLEKISLEEAALLFDVLVNTLQSTEDIKIKHKIAIILHDLKDKRALPILIDEIKKNPNRNYTGTFIYSCENFDCSKYFDFFIELLVEGDNEEAMTVPLVIENMKGPFKRKSLEIVIGFLKNIIKKKKSKNVLYIKETIELLNTLPTR